MTQLSTSPYKGTRDFYPEDMRVRNYIFSKIKSTLHQFGYQEYDGPMLEPFELYASKTSEEIVNEQLYHLIDRGERKLAVRPEMTPTLARMVAARIHEIPKPIRWFSIPNLWRYERPQRGRLREHWQLNVDTFGGEPLYEDLEIAQVIVGLMNGLGANQGFEVRLSHRGLTDFIFKELLKLDETKIPTVGKLLDTAPKMKPGQFEESLKKDASLDDTQIALLKSLFEKELPASLKTKLQKSPHYAHLTGLLEKLHVLGIGSFFRYDPSIMRGFLYYTGMVLEVFDLHPDNNRALFGGGRYDGLVGMFGGPHLSGVGFGMGDVTLRNFLETNKLLPDLEIAEGILCAPLSETEHLACEKLAADLRKLLPGISIQTPLGADKPRKVFTIAEKLRARAVIFVGSNEVASNQFSMKDIVKGESFQGTAKDLANAYLEFTSK